MTCASSPWAWSSRRRSWTRPALLQARGTEDATEIERRLSRATDEIEFALSARCFEYSVVNTEVEAAYDELKAIVLRVLGDA